MFFDLLASADFSESESTVDNKLQNFEASKTVRFVRIGRKNAAYIDDKIVRKILRKQTKPCTYIQFRTEFEANKSAILNLAEEIIMKNKMTVTI